MSCLIYIRSKHNEYWCNILCLVLHCCRWLQYYEELLIEECINDCSEDQDDAGVVCYVSPPTTQSSQQQPSQQQQQQQQPSWQQPSQQPYSVVDGMQSLNVNGSGESRSNGHRAGQQVGADVKNEDGFS